MQVSNLQKQLNAFARDSIDQWLSSLQWYNDDDEEEEEKTWTCADTYGLYRTYCIKEQLPVLPSGSFAKKLRNGREFITGSRTKRERSITINRKGLEAALPAAPDDERDDKDNEPDFSAAVDKFWNSREKQTNAADEDAGEDSGDGSDDEADEEEDESESE